MKRLTGSVMPVLLLLATAVVAAPIYTWQDKDGNTHYSDSPSANEGQVRKTDLQTRLPPVDGQQQPASSGYSVREQMEYFDRKREEKRQAWLDRQRLRQEARAQELQALELQRQAEQPQPPVIVSQPYYRPSYRPRRRPHPMYRKPTGIQSSSPYALQYLHQGDHHRFNLNIGNQYPSYPLNFWKR